METNLHPLSLVHTHADRLIPSIYKRIRTFLPGSRVLHCGSYRFVNQVANGCRIPCPRPHQELVRFGNGRSKHATNPVLKRWDETLHSATQRWWFGRLALEWPVLLRPGGNRNEGSYIHSGAFVRATSASGTCAANQLKFEPTASNDRPRCC